MASNNRDPDPASMDMIVKLLQRQESNMNRRLDMLENKLDSVKLEIAENIKGIVVIMKLFLSLVLAHMRSYLTILTPMTIVLAMTQRS